MSLKHGLLGLLNYSEMTGYELGKAFRDSLSFFWQAQSSQIYRELNKLEDAGLLISHIEIQTDKPNKRVYAITESGRSELQAWLATAMPDELMATKSEALMRIFFSSEKSIDENIKALEKLASTYEKEVAEISEISAIIDSYKPFARSEKDALYWELTADFGRAHSKMCLEWVQSCIRRLQEEKK